MCCVSKDFSEFGAFAAVANVINDCMFAWVTPINHTIYEHDVVIRCNICIDFIFLSYFTSNYLHETEAIRIDP